MHDKRIPEQHPEHRLSDEARENGLLNRMLVESPSYPWSVDEIARELQDPLGAEDSIRSLVEAGLAHRSGGFVWPSRAARRAAELRVGTV
jgi:hypothetical protein